jgi:hypothetical protein
MRQIEVGVPGGVLCWVETGPVVEPGTAEGLDGGVEGQGMDEVERASRGDAGAPDVAGVVGDLGLVEDDLEEGSIA